MDQVLDENLVSDLEGPGPPPPVQFLRGVLAFQGKN